MRKKEGGDLKLSGTGKDSKLKIQGKIYTKLLDDLVNHPALAEFDLGKAATLAPKEGAALNIESLAADGRKLWIGFRSPKTKNNETLLVPLLNPTEIIREDGRAQLGDPVTLKLGGFGRSRYGGVERRFPDYRRGFRRSLRRRREAVPNVFLEDRH